MTRKQSTMKLYPFVAWFTRIYFLLFVLSGYFLLQHPQAVTQFAFTKYWHWRHPGPQALLQWKLPVHPDLVAGVKEQPNRVSLHPGLKEDPYISVYVKEGAFELTAWRDIYQSKGFEKITGEGCCVVSGMLCEKWGKRRAQSGEPREDIKVIITSAKTIVGYTGSPKDRNYLEETLKGMQYRDNPPVA